MKIDFIFCFITFFFYLQGVIRVHVVEAKHLMKKDIGMLGKGKSDPYAVISVGAQEFRTQTINNSVDPKWDYWCEVSLLFSFIILSNNRGSIIGCLVL